MIKLNIKDSIGKLRDVNILDGQKRGEVVARRAFVLLVGALIIYLLLLAFVGKKDQNSQPVEAQEPVIETGVDGNGDTFREGEVVNGQPVVVEDGKAYFIQPEDTRSAQFKAIESFTQSYRGSRIDAGYLALLKENCSEETLRVVVAMSVSETGMGRDVKRQSNFWGWFAGGNRNYDPSREVMAKVICNGIEKSYKGIGTNDALIKKYTGNSSPKTWKANFTWAYNQMEVK